MLTQGTKYNILPFFNTSEIKNYAKTMKDLIIPFGGSEILLIIPFTAKNKKSPKIAFFTIMFIGLFYILIVESSIMILGINNAILMNDAFIEAIKITEAPVIERMDLFYLTFGLSNLISGLISIFSAIVEFTCKIFPKIKRYFIVLTIAIILFVTCLFSLNVQYLDELYSEFAIYLVLISSFLIPMTIFILAKLKKRA